MVKKFGKKKVLSSFKIKSNLFLNACFKKGRMHGRVVKSVVLMAIEIARIAVQNVGLLPLFCCALGKNSLGHFPLLDGLGKQLKILVISPKKKKKTE